MQNFASQAVFICSAAVPIMAQSIASVSALYSHNAIGQKSMFVYFFGRRYDLFTLRSMSCRIVHKCSRYACTPSNIN